MTEWFPGYTPAITRTQSEIMQELDRRTGYVQGEVRIIDPATVKSPEPPEERKFQPSKFIAHQTKRKKGKFTTSTKNKY